MVVGRSLFVALMALLAVVKASVRDIPIKPKYFKNYTAQIKDPVFVPNFVIENFAGTRDSRSSGLDLDADTINLIGTNVDYASFTDNGFTGISGGNNVYANEAKFTGVYGLGYDYDSHSVYITDYCVIRKVAFNGIVSVYAGSFFDTYRTTYYDDVFVQQLGQSCGFNDDCPANQAMFSYPYSLAVDDSNNVYVADTENQRIRFISSAGFVSTFAGYGARGGAKLVDGGFVKDSFIGHVTSIAYASGNVYFHFVDENPSDLTRTIWAAAASNGALTRLASNVYATPYGSLFANANTSSLYVTFDSGSQTGIKVIPFTGGNVVDDVIPATAATGSYKLNYLSVAGDRYGTIYYFTQEETVSQTSLSRKCTITRKRNGVSPVVVAGGGECGASTVGSPSMQSRLMPGYFMVINKYDDVLWAQHYQESFADKTFYTAGVMSLTLAQPTSVPTSQPSQQPSSRPSTQPSSQPSGQPTGRPTTQPSRQPTGRPTTQPSGQPTSRPTTQPTGRPTTQPTGVPTGQPTGVPTGQPTGVPTGQPTGVPTRQPTSRPTGQPTGVPTRQPTSRPTGQPTSTPTTQPTNEPTSRPSAQPTNQPSGVPTGQPSTQPTGQPTGQPTYQPTNAAITLTRGEITGAVVGAIVGTFILAVLAYFGIAAYRKSNGLEEPVSNRATNAQV